MNTPQQIDEFLVRIRTIWESARGQAVRSVNVAQVQANWLIGQQIVKAEQAGEQRATYGKQILKGLSQQLTNDYGRGFSVSALQYMRAFYLAYPDLLQKQHAVRVISTEVIDNTISNSLALKQTSDDKLVPGILNANLSWTHYRTLLKVERIEARNFYEIEAIKNNWSARQLERQISSLLFDRLIKSRDQQGLISLANEGLVPVMPTDVIKDPYVLEFLDLPESTRLTELDLETALLSQLHDFLLELGNGFAFVGRQVRLTLDGDHFYPDLVFYHIKLKCYVVIDLKLGKLDHADLGQMQLYVNYYDREIKESADNPTVGLVLCSEKNDAVVRYVLDEKQQQIFASRYQLYMPTEDQLRQEIQREISQLENVPEAKG